MNDFIKSFGYAMHGVRAAFDDGRNLKIQTAVALAVLVLGFFFSLQRWEWCVVLLCMALVFSLEIMNSALENLVDVVSPGWTDAAGRIKDMAAAAVLVSSVFASIVGVIIFWPYILNLF